MKSIIIKHWIAYLYLFAVFLLFTGRGIWYWQHPIEFMNTDFFAFSFNFAAAFIISLVVSKFLFEIPPLREEKTDNSVMIKSINYLTLLTFIIWGIYIFYCINKNILYPGFSNMLIIFFIKQYFDSRFPTNISYENKKIDLYFPLWVWHYHLNDKKERKISRNEIIVLIPRSNDIKLVSESIGKLDRDQIIYLRIALTNSKNYNLIIRIANYVLKLIPTLVGSGGVYAIFNNLSKNNNFELILATINISIIIVIIIYITYYINNIFNYELIKNILLDIIDDILESRDISTKNTKEKSNKLK
ncbi:MULTISPECIES: hypothetical protein [unclassified Gemella]|uniref:hypothetical protein n=1 Tax=unclassified Gemella TaxID=2624949 RepID=UPI001073ACDA|nr:MULTISPECIES: hypothetical protein [unclassified Gemella]MBF0709683.1 hypothetical protein [Gemella sp. GL1.1]MBF0746898.1 hypothetical protein [Gemella sp. 19428wG2_WT2a]NYS27027.1 hypothetical protein [Gemella sp. GL1]TFU59124.1 hypothetical protein E4T67_04445 [Gemella sp. WT2a]